MFWHLFFNRKFLLSVDIFSMEQTGDKIKHICHWSGKDADTVKSNIDGMLSKGGTDITLDMSSDWAGTNLTTWGKYVFCEPSYGIQATSKMAYTLKSYDGEKEEGPVEQPEKAMTVNLQSQQWKRLQTVVSV